EIRAELRAKSDNLDKMRACSQCCLDHTHQNERESLGRALHESMRTTETSSLGEVGFARRTNLTHRSFGAMLSLCAFQRSGDTSTDTNKLTLRTSKHANCGNQSNYST